MRKRGRIRKLEMAKNGEKKKERWWDYKSVFIDPSGWLNVMSIYIYTIFILNVDLFSCVLLHDRLNMAAGRELLNEISAQKLLTHFFFFLFFFFVPIFCRHNNHNKCVMIPVVLHHLFFFRFLSQSYYT